MRVRTRLHTCARGFWNIEGFKTGRNILSTPQARCMLMRYDSDCIAGELRALLMGLSLGGLPKTAGENADIDSEVGMLMTEFDSNQDGSVSREEFKSSLERCAAIVA